MKARSKRSGLQETGSGRGGRFAMANGGSAHAPFEARLAEILLCFFQTNKNEAKTTQERVLKR